MRASRRVTSSSRSADRSISAASLRSNTAIRCAVSAGDSNAIAGAAQPVMFATVASIGIAATLYLFYTWVGRVRVRTGLTQFAEQSLSAFASLS